jgi:hypothetical protein
MREVIVKGSPKWRALHVTVSPKLKIPDPVPATARSPDLAIDAV